MIIYKLRRLCRLLLNKIAIKWHKVFYLNIADLFLPFEGHITAGQYIVVSRILDIESTVRGVLQVADKNDRVCSEEANV